MNLGFVRDYDNIVIMSHCRDELVFFYDYITHRSLVILVTTPSSEREFGILNSFISERGCELIILKDIDTFNTSYQLSNNSKDIIKTLLSTKKYDKIITQTKTTLSSDPVSRQVYDFIVSLNISGHYVIQYDASNNKSIPNNFNSYANMYASVYLLTSNDINKRVNMFKNTYRSVKGIVQVS